MSIPVTACNVGNYLHLSDALFHNECTVPTHSDIIDALFNPGDPENLFDIFVIDIETNGLPTPYIEKPNKYVKEADTVHCVGVWHNDEVFSLDLSSREAHKIAEQLKPAKGKCAIYIAHNGAAFDFPMLGFSDLSKGYYLFDTKILATLLKRNPEQSVSLKTLAEELAPHCPKSEYTGGWDKLTPEMEQYCLQDVNALVECLKKIYSNTPATSFFMLEELIPKTDIFKIMDLEVRAAFYLYRMGQDGVGFDLTKAQDLMHEKTLQMSVMDAELQAVFPPIVHQRISEKTGKTLKPYVEVFNPGSRDMIAKRFTDKYGWKPEELTPTGKAVIDETILEKMSYPEARILEKYFKLQKDCGFLSDWILRASNTSKPFPAIHHKCNSSGTVTWRCSHSDPNLGQVTKDKEGHTAGFRKLFLPHPGQSMYGADLKNLEFYMLGHYLEPYDKGVFIDICKTKDIHSENAVAFGFVKTSKEAPSKSQPRELSKTGGFAILYGAGPGRIMELFKCDYNKAKKYIDAFKDNRTGFRKLLEDLSSAVCSRGYIRGLDSRPLLVRSEHAALNVLLQSAGAIVAKTWVKHIIQVAFEYDFKIKLLLFVHDEVQFSGPPVTHERKELWKKITLEAADRTTKELNLKCPITCEPDVGPNWAETH